MSGQRCHHEFHILIAIYGLTHVAIFEDSLRKPMLICDSCVSYYDNYKLRQMLGVSKVMTLDEYVGLLPDCMFICKMLQSDWLDCGTWTICTFPYRRSGPFIRFLIKVKT